MGKTKPPVDTDVATDDPSLNSVPSPTNDVVLNCNNVPAAGTALSHSAPVALQCSAAK